MSSGHGRFSPLNALTPKLVPNEEVKMYTLDEGKKLYKRFLYLAVKISKSECVAYVSFYYTTANLVLKQQSLGELQ